VTFLQWIASVIAWWALGGQMLALEAVTAYSRARTASYAVLSAAAWGACAAGVWGLSRVIA
jgi:hypothetical protein